MSTFAWDVVNYIIPCGCSLLVVYGFQIEELVSNGAFPATALLFFGYGTSVAAFTYCLSYLFKSHSAAQNVVLVANLLVFLLLIISSVMSAIESTCKANQVRTVLVVGISQCCVCSPALVDLVAYRSCRTSGVSCLAFRWGLDCFTWQRFKCCRL